MEQIEQLAAPLAAIFLLLVVLLVWYAAVRRKAAQPAPPEETPQPILSDDQLPPPPDLRPKPWLSDSPKAMLDGAIHDDFVRLLDRFISIVLKEKDVSVSVLMQLTGYHQAAKFVDHMEMMGLIGPSGLTQPREIFITEEQYQNVLRKRLFRYRTELEVPETEFVTALLDRLKRDIVLIRNGTLTADTLSDDLLADIDPMDDAEFEAWCTDLLTKLGYRLEPLKVRNHGAHILMEKDDVLYAMRCVGSATELDDLAVHEVFSSQRYYGRHVAILMTNQTLSPDAHKLAQELNILLWDRNKLKLLIERVSLLPF